MDTETVMHSYWKKGRETDITYIRFSDHRVIFIEEKFYSTKLEY